jgi:hypothetical protein
MRFILVSVGFEVLTAVSTKIAVFWVVAPFSLVEVYQHFRGLIKSSRATSRVSWLKYEDTDVLQNPENEGSDGPGNVGVFVF